ncbi:MAG: RluA family pseudouridine synthase [Treponema sp.]|jgi:23S rRNA pseudouridine1911/1915/1917 synthase|nr:RluA family pseudouridine synthase [Treponema sp.]
MPHKDNAEGNLLPRFSCVVDDIPAGLRLDRYAAENLKLLSRSQIKARKLRARVNSRDVKISRILKPGDRLDFFWEDAEPIDLIPEDIPLDIIYEDDRVALINKAQGMVVHPGAGNRSGTLANALYFRSLQKGRSLTAGTRPGIVHRLDKDTSGLIITAWDEEAHLFLAEQFKSRKVIKTYAAIVQGRPIENTGRIEMPIGRNRKNRKLFAVDLKGKPSLTFYKVVRSYQNYSLLLLRPKTGRTHQLRVHLKYLGIPVLGDPLYGKMDSRFPIATLMLHAKKLSIALPGKGRETFRTKFPERFSEFFAFIHKYSHAEGSK